MRPEHKPHGDPCQKCGMAAARHRKRARDRGDYHRERARFARKAHKASAEERQIIGIDGEGYTLPDGRHLYTYMAACDESGLVSELSNDRGITTREVFEWLLSLPKGALLVGFSLSYDRTKWLEGLPSEAVYKLEHPEERPGKFGPRPMKLASGGVTYKVNLLSTKFSVGKPTGATESKGSRNGKQRIVEIHDTRHVWDLFKFFQCSFVAALRRWGVGSAEEVDRIEAMKAKRGNFRGIELAERRYCQDECRLLALLAKSLIKAHDSLDLKLKTFYGPGSTASLILARCKAEEQRSPVPDDMRLAVSSAFFGGRFEASHVGPVAGPLFASDLAGAYPYAYCFIPCMAHGHFEHVTGESELYEALQGDAPAALSFRVDPHPDACLAWGPLPHRMATGDIVFPVQSAGGWAWNVEIRPAMRLHPGVKLLEGWVWRPECSHACPFREEFLRGYLGRLEHGKNTLGLTIRLGYNSTYGKSAQQVGDGGRYKDMVRAGLITAMTRGRLLEGVLLAKEPWNVLELATDSILSRERIEFPPPVRLGTEEAAAAKGKGPLGSWEPKPWTGGVMLLRPGLRFAIDAGEEELDRTAARGVGNRVLHKNRARLLAGWAQSPMGPTTVQQPAMFHGSKSSTRRKLGPFLPDGSRTWVYERDPLYGRWEEPKPRVISYAPAPKRSGVCSSPVAPGAIALVPWELPQGSDHRSIPYRASPEEIERVLASEQPEADLQAIV